MTSSNPTVHLDEAARKRARGTILLTAFLDILGFSIIIPQLAVYAAQFGATPYLTGVLASVYSLMSFLFTPVWGRLSDQYGRRPILLVSIFGSGIGYLIFGFAGSLWMLFGARLIDGITGGNISTAQAYLSDITPAEKRAGSFALFGATFGIAFAIGPLIGAQLAHLPGAWGGNLGLGVFSATLAGINWILALFTLKETLSPEMLQRNRSTGGFAWPFSGYKKAFSSPRLAEVIAIGFLATTAFATLQGIYAIYVLKEYTRPIVQSEIRANPQAAIARARQLQASDVHNPKTLVAGEGGATEVDTGDVTQPYTKELGGDWTQNLPSTSAPADLSWRHIEKLIVRPESALYVGHIFGVIGLLSLLVQGGAVRPLQKRVSEKNLLISGTFIMAIGLSLVALMDVLMPHQFWGQYIACAVLTLGNGFAGPILTSLVSQLAPEHERGEVLGVFQSTQSLGRIVGPNIGGILFGVASGLPFWVGGVIMLLSFAMALTLKVPNKVGATATAAPSEA